MNACSIIYANVPASIYTFACFVPAGNDFVAFSTVLVFTTGDSLCLSVDIIDDSVPELDQSFLLRVTSLTPSVITVADGGDQATVTIIDDDGM